MARNSRLVLNRSALDKVTLAVGDGFAALGEAILVDADPPDATPYGEGLVDAGGYLVYVGGKKIAGFGLDGRQPKKPRAVSVRKHGIVGIVGYGFPGRFQELGVIHHPAQPFLSPAVDRVAPRATEIIAPVVRPALARIP